MIDKRLHARMAATTCSVLAFALVASSCGGAAGHDPQGHGISVAVTPNTPTVVPQQILSLQAVVTGTANTAVTWSVQQGPSGGTITADGVYTAPANTGVFTIVATSQAAPVSGTATVTVADSPSVGGAPMTTANRTSGVAPLAVFFDAVNDVAASSPKYRFAWASGVAQPADMEGASFDWNFGDGTTGTWATTGRSKNTATGYTAAHVYENPGTYTATLTVTDVAGNVATYAQTITVTDPETVFASTTKYVAAPASGGSDANPGTRAQPYATIDRAMSTIASGTRRILLNRGDTFAVNTSYAITAAGPGLIGAYGSGAKPIINVSELGVAQAFATRAPDWRIMDLDFRCPGTGSATGPAGPSPDNVQTVNLLLLRLSTRGSYVAFGWSYYGVTAAGSPHDGIFLVECDEPVQPGAYGAYVGGRRLALLGNTIRGGSVRDRHALRMWQGHKVVISNNDLRDPGGTQHALKLHGIEPAFPTAPETRWASITDNIFRAGESQWTVSLGSQSSAADETAVLTHFVIERNTFIGGPNTVADMQAEASNAIVRNNVFNDAAASGNSSILWQQRNAGIPAPTDVRLYANTAYGPASFLSTNATLTNARVRNTLVSTPGGLVSLIDGTAGAGLVQDHNIATAAAAASIFTNAGAGDFTLAAGSVAIDAGATLGEVPEDFRRVARDGAGPAYDAGAFEAP